MRRIFTIIGCLFALHMSVSAVAVKDVAGTFSGSLNIGGTLYSDKEVFLLPGVESNTVTFVLPDFMFGAASLGNIVLVNIPMDAQGQLTLDGASLYIKAIMERATVSVLSGSSVSASSANISLSIEVDALPEPLSVVFSGQRTNKNYAFKNGGFEGNWTNNEPSGWHSFGSATGSFASFVSGNTDQFTQSSETRPGSTGSHSARLKSTSMFGVKANGNCTNGQINAGSMTASDGSKNYNFSDPSNSGYNTPFAGAPDSLVFWAKYIPADQKPNNSSNKARAHAVVTTNARYQDPEVSNNYSAVKIAEAEINYSATSSMGWQRIAVPFTYYAISPDQVAYMLMTFTTNKEPGGGTTSSSSVDNIYLDDVEMIYNYGLTSLTIDGAAIALNNGQAVLSQSYSDSSYLFAAKTNGVGARSFIGYEASSNRVYVYVVANNYAQAKNYTVYTVQMAEPEIIEPQPDDTQFSYADSICAGETYSDDLFQDLTEPGSYTTILPNMQGADSIVTLTLYVLPNYLFEEEIHIALEDTVWHGHSFSGLEASDEPYIYYDSLLTVNGCDSVYRLQLFVSAVPRTFGTYIARLCEGDSIEFEGQVYTEPFEGDIRLEQTNIYGGDSVVHLTVLVNPNYTIEEYWTIRQGAQREWEGIQLGDMPGGAVTLTTSSYTVDDCDSTRVLHLSVISTTKPWRGGTDSLSVPQVCGRYDGELNIAGEVYAGKSLFVLPGTVDSTVTLVLPEFAYKAGKLGNIVIPNVPMSIVGQLILENRSLYMDSIAERATVTMINGLKDESTTYYSLLSPVQAQIVLFIETPSLPEAILVFFRGDAVCDKNYSLTNGGFEGAWTNDEPQGWHSFTSATGELADFVKSNSRFALSNEVRPGSTGTQSALISSEILLGVKANGNCTNGQINAGSMTADNPASNYNFSDPANTGFNTPFNGRPDSIVFWAKYLPADRDAANEENKARINTIITTDARYQDPEAADIYKEIKIGAACMNYSATADMSWQRIAVPFVYSAATADKAPAYILTTFSTNYQPGGGSSYTTDGSTNRRNVLDSVWLDDVEVVYNKHLDAFYHGAETVTFDRFIAQVNDTYCDDCIEYAAFSNGVSAKSFIAFDEAHKCIYIYVIADDYTRTLAYNLYRVEFSDSRTDDLKPVNPSEEIESVLPQSGAYEKVLYNGQLFIRRGNEWFTVSGFKCMMR